MGLIPDIGDLLKPIKDIVSEAVVDKDKRDQVNLELKRIEDQAQSRLDAQVTGQIEVNKLEATNASTFVAGWRPAVGWVGAAGFAWITLLQPMASWTASVVFEYKGGFPTVQTDVLLYMLGGLLGFGGLRSFEKYKGVAGVGPLETISQAPTAASVEVSADTKTGAVSVETTPVVASKSVKKKWKVF